MIFGIKEKFIILTHKVYILAVVTNIPLRLKTAFVLQGHILNIYMYKGLIFYIILCVYRNIIHIHSTHIYIYYVNKNFYFECD